MARPERRIDTLRIRVPARAGEPMRARQFGAAVAHEIAWTLRQAGSAMHTDRLDVRVHAPGGAPWSALVPRIASAVSARLASVRSRS